MYPLLCLLAVFAFAQDDSDKRVPVSEAETKALADRIVAVYKTAFVAEPDLKVKLAHLVPVVEDGLKKPGWFRVVKHAGFWGNARGTKGIDLSDQLTSKPALLGVETLWHEAQHVADRARLDALKKGKLDSSIFLPLEAEQRGYEAGCAFWATGKALQLDGGEKSCDGFPLKFYSCGHDWAAEAGIWQYEKLMKAGSSPADVDAKLKELDAKKEDENDKLASLFEGTSERALRAQCLEVERSATGNSLGGDGAPTWTIERCVGEAVKAVLKDDFKTSIELCGIEDDYRMKKTDIRKLAKAVKKKYYP